MSSTLITYSQWISYANKQQWVRKRPEDSLVFLRVVDSDKPKALEYANNLREQQINDYKQKVIENKLQEFINNISDNNNQTQIKIDDELDPRTSTELSLNNEKFIYNLNLSKIYSKLKDDEELLIQDQEDKKLIIFNHQIIGEINNDELILDNKKMIEILPEIRRSYGALNFERDFARDNDYTNHNLYNYDDLSLADYISSRSENLGMGIMSEAQIDQFSSQLNILERLKHSKELKRVDFETLKIRSRLNEAVNNYCNVDVYINSRILDDKIDNLKRDKDAFKIKDSDYLTIAKKTLGTDDENSLTKVEFFNTIKSNDKKAFISKLISEKIINDQDSVECLLESELITSEDRSSLLASFWNKPELLPIINKHPKFPTDGANSALDYMNAAKDN